MSTKTFLPPGFRFHPTDVELVWYYLKRKVMGKSFRFEAISEVELYKFPPWELPEKSRLRTKDLKWYFFCPRDKKYPKGPRTNRATDNGFWKATGRDRSIIHNSVTVGMKKTLIFHVGKPPKGNRTDWVMYEYRLESKELVDAGYSQDAYVLCEIFQKSGPGPKIGEQYGAPFNEEDWEEDTNESSIHLPCVSCPSTEPLNNQSIALHPVTQQTLPAYVGEVPSDPVADGILLEDLEVFLNISPIRENANVQVSDSTILGMHINEASLVDQEEIFNELEALSARTMISGNTNYAENIHGETSLHPMLSELGSDQYMELNDFCFIEDSNPPKSIMPSDPFAPNPSTHCPNFQHSSQIDDSISYLNDNGSGLYSSYDAGPNTMCEQSSLGTQNGDFGGFAHHLNVPNEYQHLSQEHHPAIFSGPFR
ncbi:NAC domain-containing protein [Canna indica]|uniref:NAC domain-containing protein n=1 Tax=Canna indica TaxID=4628 RepID=A0AAQ3JXE4_9LILI|nr:NAC domain-containing protein [Canna indica]